MLQNAYLDPRGDETSKVECSQATRLLIEENWYVKDDLLFVCLRQVSGSSIMKDKLLAGFMTFSVRFGKCEEVGGALVLCCPRSIEEFWVMYFQD